jgi:8-oxo-dGTP diphosphatase
LPGGFLDMDETPEQAALRELKEETSIELQKITQFKTYGALDRDPRHRTISIVFYALFQGRKNEVKAADDAAQAQWFAWKELPELAFDHGAILNEFFKTFMLPSF